MMKHKISHRLVLKLRPGKRARQAGNIFFMLFASIGLIAAFSLGANNIMKGLVTSMSDVTRKTIAEEKMASGARLVFQNPVETSPATADCDLPSEPPPYNYIEPLVTRDAGTLPHPAGGGLIPLNIGAETKDPWGTQYGYCAWDPGVATCADSISPRRLRGAPNDPDAVVVAIISAGKDRKFSTTCTPTGAGGAPADCTGLGDNHYNDPASGHCYYFKYASLNHDDAQADCTSHGGYLAVPSSTTEGNMVYSNFPNVEYWIGVDDLAAPGTWVYSYGEMAGVQFWNGLVGGSAVGSHYAPWNTSEPSNTGGAENCAILNYSNGTGNTWTDVPCASWTTNYMCEIPNGTPAAPAADCSSNSTDYYNDPVSKHCYFKTTTGGDFAYATAQCAAGGGYLAAITSGTEEALIDAHIPHYASFIGISDAATEGVWKFTGGEVAGRQFWQGTNTGSVVGGLYNDWDSSGEPNNSYGNENCGMKYFNGSTTKWFDTDCGTTTNTAICEKDPPVLKQSSVDRATGSDDIVMQYSYNDIRGMGGQDLWKVNSTLANTATIDKNINVGGTAGSTFDGSINLLKDGLLLPNDTTSGACTVGGANEESLRLNTTTSPISLEICHGGAWVPISVGSATAGGPDPNYDPLHPNCIAGNNGPWVLKKQWSGAQDWVYSMYQSGIKGTMFAGGASFGVKFDGTDFTNLGRMTGGSGGDNGSIPVPYKSWIVAADGNGSNKLFAYTFNGTNFTHVGTDFTGLNGPESIWADDTYVYVGDNTKLYAFTFNGSIWTKVAQIATGNDVTGIYGDGAYIYIANFDSGIKAFKFDGANFTQVASLNLNSDWTGGVVQTMDGTLFVAAYVGGIYAVKFNGLNFTNLGQFDPDGVTSGVATDGYHIFTSNNHNGNGGGRPDLYAVTFDGANFTDHGYYTTTAYDNNGNAIVDGTYVYASDTGDITALGGFECTKAATSATRIPAGALTYLKFDETGGSVANDSSGRDNYGNLVNGPTFTTGKANGAIALDNSNDYVELVNESQFDIEKNKDLTLSAWIYVTDNNPHDFVGKVDAAAGFVGYGLGEDSSSLYFVLKTTGGWNSAINMPKPTRNAWHHIVGTYKGSAAVGTTSMKLYLDGSQVATSNGGDNMASGASMLNNKPVHIGFGDGAGDPVNGKIDGVVIYDRALTQAEITTLYNVTGGDASSGSSGNAPFVLPSGNIGYWKFDEASGTSAADSSANGNAGTLSAGASFTAGHVGGAVLLNGTNGFVTIGKPASLNNAIKTMCAWIDPTTNNTEPGIFDKGDNSGIGVQMYSEDYGAIGGWFHGGYRQGDTEYNMNTWVHVCVTWDGTSTLGSSIKHYINGVEYTGTWAFDNNGGSIGDDSSYNLYIGKVNQNSNFFKGKIDEAMVFNRPLTSTEINNIYNRKDSAPYTGPKVSVPGMPSGVIGYWSFDEASGTTAADGSGNGNNGTLMNGGTFVAGKKGNAIQLDGVDDYVNVGKAAILNDIKPLTICTWTRMLTHPGGYIGFVDKTSNGEDGLSFYSGQYETDQPHYGLQLWPNGGPLNEWLPSTQYGEWNHICGTWDGGATCTHAKMYANGTLISGYRYCNDNSGPLSSDAAHDMIFGRVTGTAGTYLNGNLDELVIFNRALSADEVRQVYGASGGIADYEPNPSVVMAANQYKGKLGVGNDFTCMLKPDGSPWCAGADATTFQLGNGSATTPVDMTVSKNTLSKVNDTAAFTSISAGVKTTCGIKADASAWCWGDATSGKLGNGTTTPNAASPVPVSGGYLWTQISVGNTSVCGIRNDGALYCWGSDNSGRLGNGAGGNSTTPGASSDAGPWVQVSVGNTHACGIKTNGTLWCWGANDMGQLGIGSNTTQQSPFEVAEPGPWVSIATGDAYSCGVKLDGSAWCWGRNNSNQLGTSSTGGSQLNLPGLVNGGGGWLEIFIAPMGWVTYGIKMDGTGWFWGNAGNGAGGGGTNITSSAEPVKIMDPGPWAALGAGVDHACGIKIDGSAWCWGADTNGQLSNGATLTADQYSPTRVLNFPDIAPFVWNDTATALTAQGTANIGMGANSAIGYDGSVISGVPNGLRFDAAGQTVLREAAPVGTAWTPPSGMLGWWKFDEASGTSASDSSGNGITGTVSGGASFVAGKNGNAISLNGTNAYINMGHPAALANVIKTSCAWINAQVPPDYTIIFDKNNSGTGGMQLYSGRDNPGDLGLNQGSGYRQKNNYVPYNTWHHVCGVWSGAGTLSSLTVYLDGVLASSYDQTGGTIDTASDASGDLRVGSLSSGGGYFKGLIDDAMIFNRALTAGEIADIYANSGQGITSGTTSGVQLKIESQAASTSSQLTWKTTVAASPRSMGIDYANANFEIGPNVAAATSWMDAITGQLSIATNGYVGLAGVAAPVARLDLSATGNLRVGTDTGPCVPLRAGTLRYVGGATPYEYCDGAAWTAF